MAAGLSESDLHIISIIERVCSVFSVLGCIFVILTFTFSSAFYKPVNRLVFYASFGNLMMNVGTLMALTQTDHEDSFGCQFQGFLIQTFGPADAFWTLALAINVYLTFYYRYDSHRLRRMELKYILCCYGLPLLPGIIYIFIRNSDGQRVYGNAGLWCWVVTEWEVLRIATYYGPAWVTILVTFAIYVRVGVTIYNKRKSLRHFQSTDQDLQSMATGVDGTIKVTEVTVITEQLSKTDKMLSERHNRNSVRNSVPPEAYSVTISSTTNASNPESNMSAAGAPNQGANILARPRTTVVSENLDRATWSYTKCALLFFTALLVTWIPSSANRVYSIIHAHDTSIPLEYMSAFVLPLQGFWNVLIYIVTSRKACVALLRDLRILPKRVGDGLRKQTNLPGRDGFHLGKGGTGGGRTRQTLESESMTELAQITHTPGSSVDGRLPA